MSSLVFTGTVLSNQQQSSMTRRLSILSNPRSRRHSSVSSSGSSVTNDSLNPSLTIEFDKTMIRPNKIIRGAVKLKTPRSIQASQMRIKFKAEEIASVKIKENGLEKVDRIESMITTYFDVDTVIWGCERSAYAINYWQTIEPGEHEFGFALKFPNVNFPPSTEDPAGFMIRYVWKAFLEGPANHPGLCSDEYTHVYRPLVSAPPRTPWTFQDTLYRENKKSPIAVVTAALPAQVYCPEDTIHVDMKINSTVSDVAITSVRYKFRKYCEGRLMLQHGFVSKLYHLDILQKSVPIMNKSGMLHIPDIKIDLPSRLVSPCFSSRNLRVYYSLVFVIQFDSGNSLLKSATQYTQFEIPVGMANLPHAQLAQVQDLTLIRDYRDSQEAPYFFHPSLEAPPIEQGVSNVHDHDDDMPMYMLGLLSPPPDDALLPSYFSVGEVHQFVRRKRFEKVRYSSRLVNAYEVPELGEALIVQPYINGEW